MNGTQTFLQHPEAHLDEIQRRWIESPEPRRSWSTLGLYHFNRIVVRSLFRYRTEGRDRLPGQRPLILAANHSSSIDPPLIAAALPYEVIRHGHWAGRRGRVLANRPLRWINRLTRTLPVDRDRSALSLGAAVLGRRRNLIWFPEGRRSDDGRLNEFKFGVGALAVFHQVPVVPIGISGAFRGFPPAARFPRIGTRITVRIGQPVVPPQPTGEDFDQQATSFAASLRGHVDALMRERHSEP